jgi:long-chain fatty acid transport protein
VPASPSKMTPPPVIASLLSVVLISIPASPSLAAGFGLDFEGAREVGTATAGGASAADASTIFYNPAGMVYLQQNEVLAGGQLLLLHDQFHDAGSTILGGAVPTPGTNGSDAIPTTFVPWLFASYRINPDLSIGMGLFSPFGLRTDYGPFWKGRYQNEVTAITAVDLNPSIAYRPLPWLSIGGGLDIQYVNVRLTNAVDLGSACTAELGAAFCAAGFRLQPGGSDVGADFSGGSFGVGFNLGLLVEPAPGTRIGLAYRSGFDQHFSRIQEAFSTTANERIFLAAGGTPLALTGSDATADLRLPGRISLALKQTLTDRLDLLLDATLTLWSALQSTTITASDTVTGVTTVIPLNYHNAWRIAGGLEYRLTERWNLRSGVGYDQTPIPAWALQASLPDRDRMYLGVGASFKASESFSVDVGYTHVFYVGGNVPINRTSSTGDTIVGNFDVGGNVFAAQIKLQY